MGINLALSRITKLLQILGNPHKSYKSIHIAGTNGKGSTVTYLTSILTKAQIKNGRFTSPHLLYYNDCISIDNETYPLQKFKEVSEMVSKENSSHELGCTEFELLTVTAFKIFELEKIEYAVIEVGLGGKLDATNVLTPFTSEEKGGVVVSGITKIGIDHENFLGSTFSEIASQKAGIIKDRIPVVADNSNNQEVIEVIKQKASSTNSDLYLVDGINPSDPKIGISPSRAQLLRSFSPLKGTYQLQNLSVALQIIELLKKDIPITESNIEEGIKTVVWPGRLQLVKYKNLDLLIDGAHNESAAQELSTFLKSYREDGIIFIMALSKGKSVGNLMKYVVEDSDTLIASRFSPPENMPWVSSYNVEDIERVGEQYFKSVIKSNNDSSIEDILDKVAKMVETGDRRKVVVCGSLYLCSDVLRLVNDKL